MNRTPAPRPASTGLDRPRIALTVAVSAALAAVVGVQPLYSDNQNTYLVRGIAQSVAEPLNADRLVRSADPTRFFTWIIRAVFEMGIGRPALYLLWLAAAMGLFISLWWATGPADPPKAAVLVWAALLGLLLTPAVQPVAERVRSGVGIDLPLPGQLLDGVAGQYALGHVLQPSTGAIFLVAGVAVALRTHGLRTAVGLLWLAAMIHPSYLLSAWILLAGVISAEYLTSPSHTRRQLIEPLALAVGASMLVLLANLPTFASITDGERDAGNEILAMFRIPHHSDPATWFGPDTLAKLAVIGLAIVVSHRSRRDDDHRLSAFFSVTSALVVVFTLAVVVIGSASAKLLFPWRASVVLVPLAVSYLCARLATGALRSGWSVGTHRLMRGLAVAVLVFAVGDGMRETLDDLENGPSDTAIVEAVRRSDPHGEGLIPPDLGDLRLNAQVAVYVDWKNNPNAPSAVVDWKKRLDRAEEAMTDPRALCRLVADEDFGWAVYPAALGSPDVPPCLSAWEATRADDLILAIRP